MLSKLIVKYELKKIILAIPSASKAKRREILSSLEQLDIDILTIPNMADILAGHAKIEDVSQVDINDLLGRDGVSPEPGLLMKNISDKTVLVTGAGGSIGSELCRQIILQKPSQLVLFEKNEYSLYAIEQELLHIADTENIDVPIFPILGSVQSFERLVNVFNGFGVDTIYHAAAFKHVPLVEQNVVEGIRNNVFGTLHAVKAAVEASVEAFVLVSTDKAVRPTNIMGATKRYAELVCQAFAFDPATATQFTIVRFGNVLGSSGSVIPKFRQQIEKGGPVTVTHQDITRYFMTIPEAAQLVIQAGAMSKGGEVFVLDMGSPVKIIELAQRMIRLSGHSYRFENQPARDGSIAIQIIGLRPGEKLFEELLVGDDVTGTAHESIMQALESFVEKDVLLNHIIQLENLCDEYNVAAICSHLKEMPLAFEPISMSSDLLDQARLRTH